MADGQLTRELLATILQSEHLDDRPLSDWIAWFREELGSGGFLPDGFCVSDPRTADRVVFNASRATRPLDNRIEPGSKVPPPPCIVCNAKLTKVLDVADLSDGFTLINKNLYPITYPSVINAGPETPDAARWMPDGISSYGLHLLQWTSSHHEADWHNMSPPDRKIVVDRLAALEEKLLTESEGLFPAATTWGGPSGMSGFVQIIKNSGAPVGGSVYHGHQQIALTNVMPRKARDDWRFENENEEKFTTYLLRTNPPELTLRDYGSAVLLVPYFMRRPYDMMFVLRDTSKRYLHQLSDIERSALADAWRDGIRLMRGALQSIGRHVAYNIVAHTGPGAGIYLEFLPYSQEVGGFEQSGLWSCQSHPHRAAEWLANYLSKGEGEIAP